MKKAIRTWNSFLFTTMISGDPGGISSPVAHDPALTFLKEIKAILIQNSLW